MFGPIRPEQQARTNLRRELHYLRVLLGDDPSLVVDQATLMWREWLTCRVDSDASAIANGSWHGKALVAGDDHLMLGDMLPLQSPSTTGTCCRGCSTTGCSIRTRDAAQRRLRCIVRPPGGRLAWRR